MLFHGLDVWTGKQVLKLDISKATFPSLIMKSFDFNCNFVCTLECALWTKQEIYYYFSFSLKKQGIAENLTKI